MCGMTGHLDRYGDPLEDDETRAEGSHLARTKAQIHHDRCEALRQILRESRARREAKP